MACSSTLSAGDARHGVSITMQCAPPMYNGESVLFQPTGKLAFWFFKIPNLHNCCTSHLDWGVGHFAIASVLLGSVVNSLTQHNMPKEKQHVSGRGGTFLVSTSALPPRVVQERQQYWTSGLQAL